jgi:hypothetical protein
MAEKAGMQKIDEQLPPKTQVLKKSNLRSLWILNEQLIKVFESEDYGEYEKDMKYTLPLPLLDTLGRQWKYWSKKEKCAGGFSNSLTKNYREPIVSQ